MARKPTKPENELQRIVRRLPSDQIARVMEFYTDKIIQVLCDHTDVGLEIAARCLGFVVRNRRKITPVPQKEATAALTFGMLYPQHLSGILQGLRIETSLIFGALTPERIMAMPGPIARHLDLLLRDLETFRATVIDRYRPLAMKNSSAFVWARANSGIQIEPEDTHQNFLLAVERALSKFDVGSGTLTTYVGMWMRNAWNSGFNLAIGESYTVSRAARGKIARRESALNNHAVELTHAESVIDEGTSEDRVLDRLEDQDFSQFLIYAKRAGLLEDPFAPLAVAALYPVLRPPAAVLGRR